MSIISYYIVIHQIKNVPVCDFKKSFGVEHVLFSEHGYLY